MMYTTVRDKLNEIITATSSFDTSAIPAKLQNDIKQWKWGSYGWTSPTSLIITVAWKKYFYPTQDCCKIWAKDENGQRIEGGYSIRSDDEQITIPLLAKHDLCKDFCSDNSGMQGSRALEKMRSLKRLNVDIAVQQRTIFDIKLFVSIINQINDLNEKQALEALKLLIVQAKSIKQARQQKDIALSNSSGEMDLIALLSEISDPELTKCISAACLTILYEPHGLKLDGVTDHKTAADARAEKAGDLILQSGNETLIAVEVKNKSISIDWQNIRRAVKILNAHPSIRNFLFILENRTATTEEIIREIVSSHELSTSPGNKISFLTLHDLFNMTRPITDIATIVKITGKYLAIAPSIKPETKDAWLNKLRVNS